MGMLDGKVAIVTGAGQGLGRALAQEYAARGSDSRGLGYRRRGR